MTEPLVSTYSIVACDLGAEQWGVAVQSKFLAVGSVVPWAEPHTGAVATQSYANPRYGPEGLALLRDGLAASEVVATADRPGRRPRPAAARSRRPPRQRRDRTLARSAMHWAGGRTGPCYAAQGNILRSQATVAALAETFEETAGRALAERLLDCLDAAQQAGGDSRGQQSASLLVVSPAGGYAGLSDSVVDLRVDDHELPLTELRRLYDLHQELFGRTPSGKWVVMDDELTAEVQHLLARLGYTGDLGDAFDRWCGVENLEERANGIDRIDPVVLARLRGE